MSRSNVSTSLRELITWGVVRRVHIIGDRRDRFEALKDVMETFRVIMAERRRREIDPTIVLLEGCVQEAKEGGEAELYTRQQLEKMLEFTRTVSSWYAQIDRLSTPALRRLFLGGAGWPGCSRRTSRRVRTDSAGVRGRSGRNRRHHATFERWETGSLVDACGYGLRSRG